jgi:hypothetical protein
MSENAKKNCLAGNSGKLENNQYVPNPNQMLNATVKVEKRNDKGKVTNHAIIRSKKSNHGKLAADHIIIDHMQNTKRHIVDEQDETGKWHRVWDKTIHQSKKRIR